MNNIYQEALLVLQQKGACAIRTEVPGREGQVSDLRRCVADIEAAEGERGFLTASAGTAWNGEKAVMTEPVLHKERLIVLGGGHIAVPVVSIGASCGLCVTVVDDRPSFANRERFPDAERVICDDFTHAIETLSIGPFDYVVIITRGHRHDADCLRAVLSGTEPAYTGMIGSRRRVKAQLAMLSEEGYAPERLAKVCTPIGLRIGAVTPAEIAVSIMAEIISYRRLPEYAGKERMLVESDLEMKMLEYLAENDEPKAIVTVMETKGSTPRGCGAKMAVSPIGRITGSIGGGCSEAAVMRDAIALIGTGTYKIVDIDLTGEVAEDEGMVCGGIMKVLVEDGSAR